MCPARPQGRVPYGATAARRDACAASSSCAAYLSVFAVHRRARVVAYGRKSMYEKLGVDCRKRYTQPRRTQVLGESDSVFGVPDDVERDAHGPPSAWHARRCVSEDEVPCVSGVPTRERRVRGRAHCVCAARRIAVPRRAREWGVQVRRVTGASMKPLTVPGEREDLQKPRMPRRRREGRCGPAGGMRGGVDAVCPVHQRHTCTSRRPCVVRRCRVRRCVWSCAPVHTIRSLRVRVRYTVPSLRPRSRPASWGKGGRAWLARDASVTFVRPSPTPSS